MNTTVNGLDIAKQIFHLIDLDATDKQARRLMTIGSPTYTKLISHIDVLR